MKPVLIAKSVLLIGMAIWMTVATLNNATDPGTNSFHVGAMLRMSLLENEPNELGRNLLWRAVSSDHVNLFLWVITIGQAFISIYLWKAAISFTRHGLSSDGFALERARISAISALTCFMSLWLLFMIGGFWFGYWIKQGPIQQVHMTLLILSILALNFISNRSIEDTGWTGESRSID